IARPRNEGHRRRRGGRRPSNRSPAAVGVNRSLAGVRPLPAVGLALAAIPPLPAPLAHGAPFLITGRTYSPVTRTFCHVLGPVVRWVVQRPRPAGRGPARKARSGAWRRSEQRWPPSSSKWWHGRGSPSPKET